MQYNLCKMCTNTVNTYKSLSSKSLGNRGGSQSYYLQTFQLLFINAAPRICECQEEKEKNNSSYQFISS